MFGFLNKEERIVSTHFSVFTIENYLHLVHLDHGYIAVQDIYCFMLLC